MNNDSCSKRLWGVSAQCLLSVAVICLFSACRQKDRGQAETDIFFLEGHADTTYYEQAPFEWHVTLRHDYSETYVTKFSMCHADYDPEYLGKYRMRDNGKQILFLNCEEALKAIKGMDALTLGMPKIVYLVGWQYNGHDSKYPAFFAGNDAIKRPQDEDALESIR